MKKSAVIFLAALALSLSACGTSAAEEQVTVETVQTTVVETETTTTTLETTSETTETTTTVTETTTTTAETTTETEKVCTCESEFQHACCEYLNGLNFLGGGVYFGDINGDETPEAVVAINPFGLTYVLYENESGMQELPLKTMSSWGYVRYIADTKQILFCPFFGHTWGTWGYEEYYLLDWNGSDYEATSSIFRESGIYYERDGEEYSEYGQAYIDGEEVDNDTFEVKLAEFEKLRDENNYFPIAKRDDENFESYLLENFPCFNNWESLPIKSVKQE